MLYLRTVLEAVARQYRSVLGSIVYYARTTLDSSRAGGCGWVVTGCGHAAKGYAKTRHVSCGTAATAPLIALSRSRIYNDALPGSHWSTAVGPDGAVLRCGASLGVEVGGQDGKALKRHKTHACHATSDTGSSGATSSLRFQSASKPVAAGSSRSTGVPSRKRLRSPVRRWRSAIWSARL